MHVSLKGYRHLLMKYLSFQRARVIVLVVLLFSGIALQVGNPQFLRIFIDTVSVTQPQIPLLVVALLFIGGALLEQVVRVGATYLSERVGWTATNALRIDLAQHLIGLDPSFYKEHTPGELIERVDGDVTVLATFFSQFVIRIVGSVLLMIGILIMLWFIDWRIGLALSLFALVVLAVLLSVNSIAIPYWKAFRQASADLFGFLEECLSGTEDIRSNGAQPYIMRRLFTYTRQRFRTACRARVIGSIPWTVPIVFFALGNAMAFGLIFWLYQLGEMTLGLAFIIYYYTQMIQQPVQALVQQMGEFQQASAGIARIRELFTVQSKLEDGPQRLLQEGAQEVEFDRVTFGYGGEEMVIHDLSFRLAPGEVMGVLGRTGSGKTTLARLLFRFYDPATGAVCLGGQDLRELKIDDIRKQVGMVTQDVQLFHATVRDNLTFFDADIDDAHILRALEEFGLMKWYQTLPDGLDTLLSAGGGGLSAGEAQLLAFARVFLRDPGVVILDEASSRLDPATERLIEQAVNTLLRGRTGIIIAHRLNTIQRADTVLILEHGRMSEYGPRVQLLNDSESHFAHLLQLAHEEAVR